MSTPIPNTSIAAKKEWKGGICALTYEPLDVNAIMRSLRDEAAGATAVFVGTTRNSFRGKVVTRLEYQAYSKLAIKTMEDIIHHAHNSATQSAHSSTHQNITSLISCAVHHRLGTVPVGEPSIVVAVSSPHRKEAFAACEQILEDVKERVQIWKREYYEGEREEDAEWKANNS